MDHTVRIVKCDVFRHALRLTASISTQCLHSVFSPVWLQACVSMMEAEGFAPSLADRLGGGFWWEPIQQ